MRRVGRAGRCGLRTTADISSSVCSEPFISAPIAAARARATAASAAARASADASPPARGNVVQLESGRRRCRPRRRRARCARAHRSAAAGRRPRRRSPAPPAAPRRRTDRRCRRRSGLPRPPGPRARATRRGELRDGSDVVLVLVEEAHRLGQRVAAERVAELARAHDLDDAWSCRPSSARRSPSSAPGRRPRACRRPRLRRPSPGRCRRSSRCRVRRRRSGGCRSRPGSSSRRPTGGCGRRSAVTGMSWRTQVMISTMLMPQAPSPA